MGKPTYHELESPSDLFQAMWDTARPYDVRPAGSDFKVGDWVVFRETVAGGRTGREMSAIVRYVESGDDFVILSIRVDYRGRTSTRIPKV